MADHIGGVHTASTAPTLASIDTTPLIQLTIRAKAGNTSPIYFASSSDVTSAGANAHGVLAGGEAYTWGPLPHGYVRVSEIYLVSATSTDVAFWEGVLK